MLNFRYGGLSGAACVALMALVACGREAQDEMSWARAALERNDTLEVVAADPQSRTFTVRVKDTGELRMVRADQLIAAPAAAAGAPQAARGEPPPPPAVAASPADNSGGRVLESGPGYSIKAAAAAAPASAGRVRDSAVTSGA